MHANEIPFTSIETVRLLLVSTPLRVLEERLQRDNFTAPMPLGDGRAIDGHFPSEWPGDALAVVPLWIEDLRRGGSMWGGTMIERRTGTAVGQMTFKGPPDAHGSVELGYGVNPSAQGRGYATEAARALADWALALPEVRSVRAECLETNIPSIRVLEKAGFRRAGTRESEEGPLILWERTP